MSIEPSGRSVRSWASVVALLACASGCGRQEAPAPTVPPSSSLDLVPELRAVGELSDLQLEEMLVEPRPGPWWGDREALDRSRISAAHILVAHAQSDPGATVLGAVLGRNRRPRGAALRLALALKRRLDTSKAEWSALAAYHSDDLITRDHNGELGAFMPRTLQPKLLDTLGTLPEGGIAGPIETDAGLHLIKRVPVPAQRSLAADVIRFTLPDGADPRATLQRAFQLRQRLDQGSLGFEQATAQYPEAELSDFGLWSTYEQGPSVLLHQLARMEDMELLGPLQTPNGIEIYRRTTASPRGRYVLSRVIVPHIGAARSAFASEPKAQAQAQRLASELLDRLRASPSTFDELVRAHCDGTHCGSVLDSWTRGRNPLLEPLAVSLQVGRIHSELVTTPLGFEIIRRESETRYSAPRYRFELPRPPRRNVEALVRELDPRVISGATRLLAQEAVSHLGLEGEPAERFGLVMDALVLGLGEEQAAARSAAVAQARSELLALLGPAQHARFVDFRKQWLLERLPY